MFMYSLSNEKQQVHRNKQIYNSSESANSKMLSNKLKEEPFDQKTSKYAKHIIPLENGNPVAGYGWMVVDSIMTHAYSDYSCVKIESPTIVNAHQCDICQQLLPTAQSLAVHRRTHTLDLTYTCLMCHDTYAAKTHLDTHIGQSHACATTQDHGNIEEELPTVKEECSAAVECDICQQLLPTAETLAIHRRTHSMDLSYTCLVCYAIYDTKTHLDTHIRQLHAGANARRNNGIFHNIEEPSRHRETVKGNCHKCNICKREFNRKCNLMRHLFTHAHTDEGYKCEICHELFKATDHLRHHFSTRHKGISIRNCRKSNVSQNQSNAKVSLVEPMHKHTEKLSYECDICHDRFADRFSLNCHKWTHIQKNYRRESKFAENKTSERDESTLPANLLTHTKGNCLKCHFCQKDFTYKPNLTRHLYTHAHTKEGYKCEVCHKLFSTTAHLRKHFHTYHKGISIRNCSESNVCKLTEKKFHESNVCKLAEKKCHESNVCKLAEKKCHESNVCKLAEKKCHECNVCKEQFTTKYNLIGHMYKHTGKMAFKCDICPKRFAHPSSIYAHKRHMHTEKQYLCHICSRKFRLEAGLKQHMRTHTGEKPYECDICHTKFGWKYQLTSHTMIHTGDDPFECALCHKLFNKKYNLINHIRKHRQDPYKCDICNDIFTRKDSLRLHVLVHGGHATKMHKCPLCFKLFHTKSLVSMHLRIHSAERQYKCNICNKGFKWIGSLNVHLLTHTSERPHECDTCHKRFRQKQTLQLHMVTHSDEMPYECDICHKRFKRSNKLGAHKRTHTNEKPFECNLCPKRFNFKINLTVHLRTHAGEKPFECLICEKSFKVKYSLKLHMITHAKEKSFACDKCNATFKRKGELTVHFRIHVIKKAIKIYY